VDFATRSVLGVWLGNRPTGGYTVSIYQFVYPVTVIGAPCTPTWCPPAGGMANILEAQPGGSCATPAVITQPFHIVTVPRVDGPVLYEMATRVDDCF
jgi:hypothetical protein